MFENIIEIARQYVSGDDFRGYEFKVKGKYYFVDIDSDNTLFITHKTNGEWDILIDGIERI